MRKEQAVEVKSFIDQITGKNYTKTFSSKSQTLHVRIGIYVDSAKDTEKEWITGKELERKWIISELIKRFPQYEASENNKRYQGFVNDICITSK